MVFSDKFQTINLHKILNLSETETYNPDDDPENETTEEKIKQDDIHTISDKNDKSVKTHIDLNKFEKTNYFRM